MKKITILLSAIMFITTISNAQFLKDISLEELARIDNENDVDLDELGFSSDVDIPSSSYALEQYCIVTSQAGQSCTGFAISGAMGILYNSLNDISRYTEKLVNKFDPYYIYCSTKDQNDINCLKEGGCGCGTHIHEALEIVENYGCKKWYVAPDLSCSISLNKNNLRSMITISKLYSIDGKIDLIDYKTENDEFYIYYDIEEFKYYLSRKNPIITGIGVDNDFGSLSSPNNISYGSPNEVVGAHAVTIIGYDDNYDGGSFRILNSYGQDWGENGFFWMKYDDYFDVVSGAYMILNDNWESWISSQSSLDYFKGKLKDSNSTWEGSLDSEGLLHGRGILVADDFAAAARYVNGIPDGWWNYYGDEEDAFWGWVRWEDGEVVEEEEFGFASDTENISNILHTNNLGFQLNKDIATEDDINIEAIKQLQNQGVIKKFNFNINKTNNYNKKFNFNKTNK